MPQERADHEEEDERHKEPQRGAGTQGEDGAYQGQPRNRGQAPGAPAAVPRPATPSRRGDGRGPGLEPAGLERTGLKCRLCSLWQVNEQVVELSVGLGFEAAPKPIPELIGVEAASHVLPAEYLPDRTPVSVRSPQVPIGRRSPRIVVDLLGHVAPLLINQLNSS